MARVVATLRLLLLLTKRDLKGLSSVGLNNLFFCAAFLSQGSHSPRTAFYSSLPFLLVLFVPLLFVICIDTLARIPATRAKLWPLNTTAQTFLRIASLALSPAFGFFGAALAIWMGIATALGFIIFAILIQIFVVVGVYVSRRQPRLRLMHYVPAFPGRIGGLIQVSLRQIFSSLDFYAALLLSVAGTLSRFAGKAPVPESFPILAILIALAMSTYAQRMFALESHGSIIRYRLLPLRGWQVLLAKDIAYLGVVAVLAMPLGFKPAMTFSLVAVSVGRSPSLRQAARQRPWRFMEGDVRYGVLQILAGGLMALGSSRVSIWFLAASAAGYGVSILLGDAWWSKLENSWHG